ncbi:site-specific integrase [Moellerella wisconsensis]|uniref:site-specific integrase n=1 Tax=Moellerella wisconsensis TaxID=158849 RepID=UPI00307630A2
MTLSSKLEKINLFNSYQHTWIKNKELPVNFFINSASEFDDNWLKPNETIWDFRFSGRNIFIDFNSRTLFGNLDSHSLKLIKIILIYYIIENSPSIIDKIAIKLAIFLGEIKTLKHDSVLSFLQSITDTKREAWLFFATLFAIRKLDAEDFFVFTDRDESIEDKLLFIPRPKTGDFGVYKNIDNVLPSSVISLIENGLTEWATRYTPTLNSPKEKKELFTKIKELQIESQLLDCIILGLCFITGARPVQLSKIAVQDICIDAQSNLTTRFSVMIPYAKKTKVNIERIAVALPDELGKLIYLYIALTQLTSSDPLLPQKVSSVIMVNDAINRQLIRFSSLDFQEAAKNNATIVPRYTSSLFRHNVGHSMALNGSSAEEIAYILGHSSTVAAGYYISSTPSLAEIRENALGSNPVFQNMIALMLTGSLVQRNDWIGRKVAGNINNQFHFNIGGCTYDTTLCPFSQVRACYGCLYFKPFIDGEHQKVFDSINEELIQLIKQADSSHIESHPLIAEITRRKQHVMMVMTRIQLYSSRNDF